MGSTTGISASQLATASLTVANPFADVITIRSATDMDDLRITLRSITGQQLAAWSGVQLRSDATFTLPIVSLPSGLYFLHTKPGSKQGVYPAT
jgi:hypothetical protein